MRNHGYTHDAWDKTHPLKLVWAWLEVSKFWVLESEKKTSLTCSCLCKSQHKIKPSKITYTHFEVEDVMFKTPQVLKTMYNWFVWPYARFQNDQMTGTQVKWGIQFLADFALLMAQNASFGNRGFWPVRKKEKSLVFGDEWGWEAQTSCFSDVYMYFTSFGTHRYLQINVFVKI